MTVETNAIKSDAHNRDPSRPIIDISTALSAFDDTIISDSSTTNP